MVMVGVVLGWVQKWMFQGLELSCYGGVLTNIVSTTQDIFYIERRVVKIKGDVEKFKK